MKTIKHFIDDGQCLDFLLGPALLSDIFYSQILHMEPRNFCQSCTMPIDNIADRGTENDGSKSSLYCKYCYQDGHFVNPEMTLEEMKEIVTTQMHKMNIPENIVQQSLNMLPHLKRWQRPVPEHV